MTYLTLVSIQWHNTKQSNLELASLNRPSVDLGFGYIMSERN